MINGSRVKSITVDNVSYSSDFVTFVSVLPPDTVCPYWVISYIVKASKEKLEIITTAPVTVICNS